MITWGDRGGELEAYIMDTLRARTMLRALSEDGAFATWHVQHELRNATAAVADADDTVTVHMTSSEYAAVLRALSRRLTDVGEMP